MREKDGTYFFVQGRRQHPPLRIFSGPKVLVCADHTVQRCLLVLIRGESKANPFYLDDGDARRNKWVSLLDDFGEISIQQGIVWPEIGLPGLEVLETFDQDVKVD